MNHDEKIAYHFLSSIGFKYIDYEPNGNIPPDFLVNGNTAIEVRRLNQYTNVNGTEKPLEELHFKLIPRIIKTIEEFETKEFNDTLIVSISYGRPLRVDKNLIKKIKASIYKNIKTRDKYLKVTINENLELRFFRSDLKLEKSIILGTALDYNSGGFVVSNIYKNLKLIISEKEYKIKEYYGNFESWWLILIDYIGYGLDKIDQNQLMNLPKLKTIFEKILIVSPLDIEKSFEINNKNASA
jgi:hypothetical protein